MKYAESNMDRRLRRWFQSDMKNGLLRRIHLVKGVFRGLNALDIHFEYPITAICGKNGSGKSTITALACCAFHNSNTGFKIPKRKYPYYTFSDFFIQHSSENSTATDILINYQISSDQWSPAAGLPNGIGTATQSRWKAKNGKWNDYDTRVDRTVVFLGIERVVPHSERSQSRSYSRNFKDVPLRGWENEVMTAVGYILGKSYDDFRYVVHSKYSLPIVKCGRVQYSGFNMGAGENALFDIFSIIYSAGTGALIVIDEIELGLHAEAQRKLMECLKDVCDAMHIQIICTTHSSLILDTLPPEARIYVETLSNKSRITVGVSSDFAFSKLSAINVQEVEIFVEDDVAKAILLAALPAGTRTRVNVKVVGSAAAMARQLSTAYVRKETRSVVAVFDGDQRAIEGANLDHAKKMAENAGVDFPEWFKQRCAYLPGIQWPEKWLIQRAAQKTRTLSKLLGADEDELDAVFTEGLNAGKHTELFEVARRIGLERIQCLQMIATVVVQEFDDELTDVTERIQQALDKG